MTNILLMIHGGMGDNLFHLPLFRALKERFRQSHLTVFTYSHSWQNPFKDNPFVDEIITTREDYRGKLNGRHFNYVFYSCCDSIYYHILNDGTITFDELHINWGAGRNPPALIEQYRHLAKTSGCKRYILAPMFNHVTQPKSTMLKLPYTDIDRRKALNYLRQTGNNKKNIVFMPFSSDPARCISIAKINEITNYLAQRYNMFVTGVVQGHTPRSTFDQITHAIKIIDDPPNFELGINGNGALIHESDYVIIVVSGQIALADCFSTPTIVINKKPYIQHLFYAPHQMIVVEHEYIDLTPHRIEECLKRFDNNSKFAFNYKKGDWKYDEPYHHQ